jgi:hypothetical protein
MIMSDTFKVIPVGLLPNPGTCSICGSNQRDCLDWGITVEYFGAVLVCVECCRDLTTVPELNFVSGQAVGEMLAENLRLTAREKEMESAIRELHASLAAVADGFSHRVLNSVPDTVAVAPRTEKVARNLF